MKSNKGITMISLVVTVVVLMILASVATYTGIETAKNSEYYNAIAQMKIVQAEVNEWYEANKNGEDSGWNSGTEIPLEFEFKAHQAYDSVQVQNQNIGEFSQYKYFSKGILSDTLDLNGINFDFIIDIDTRTVILIEGIQYGNETYYSLCQIEGEQYNVQYLGS